MHHGECLHQSLDTRIGLCVLLWGRPSRGLRPQWWDVSHRFWMISPQHRLRDADAIVGAVQPPSHVGLPTHLFTLEARISGDSSGWCVQLRLHTPGPLSGGPHDGIFWSELTFSFSLPLVGHILNLRAFFVANSTSHPVPTRSRTATTGLSTSATWHFTSRLCLSRREFFHVFACIERRWLAECAAHC